MQRHFPGKLFETNFIYVRRLDDEWFSYDAFSRSGIRRCLSDLRQISGKKMGKIPTRFLAVGAAILIVI